MSAGKPVLGICRGLQLINVAFGGTLYQDIASQQDRTAGHYNPNAYDQHFHAITLVAGSKLAALYPNLGRVRVNSIHHQAVKALGKDLVVEALSVPDAIIEAIRWNGPGYLVGVQWHPEFHDPANPELLDVGPLLREFLSEAAKTRSSAMQQATVQLV